MALSWTAQTGDNIYVASVAIAQSASASDVIPTMGMVPVAVFSDPTTTDTTTTHFKLQVCLTSSGTFVDALDSSSATIKAPATAAKASLFSASAYAPYVKLVAVTTGGTADAQDAARSLNVIFRQV